MNNKSVFYSSDLSNQDQIGLFDRIINLKFFRKNGETFTLHSDYEPVWSNGVLYFKTCQPKPEIKITYTQYQATMIAVDIYVTNLNIKESAPSKTKEAEVQSSLQEVSSQIRTGNTTNLPNDLLSVSGNPITKIEIEMGYRGDFYNWAHYSRDKHSAEDAYNAFINLQGLENKISKLSETQTRFAKHRRCSVTIEWAVQNNNPPDRVTQFHGYVGTTEAGFQPFGQITMDVPDEDGLIAVFPKDVMFRCLDDVYSSIDEVAVKTLTDESKATKEPMGPLLQAKGSTYRNFCNGGKGFTLLEALCFHAVTRRFVKTNINVKRNRNLEKAFLKFTEDAEFKGEAADSIKKFRTAIEQMIFKRERELQPQYFRPMDSGLIGYDLSIPKKIKETYEKTIDDLLIEKFIGARYTIKNLSEWRKLYKAIREKMTASAKEGKYITWSDAASSIDATTLPAAETVKDAPLYAEVQDTAESLEGYVSDIQSGKIQGIDTYIKDTDDWIIPLQSLKAAGPVQKNAAAKNVTVSTASGELQTIPCFTGLFEIRDAYMFGVPILCTTGASKLVEERHITDSSIELPFLSQAHLQVAWICKTYGLLNYKMNDGGYMLYGAEEDTRDIAAQDFIKSQSDAPVKIHAIYDITLSPLRMMRMPFLGFLDPMTIIEWNSSSAIGEMISFYYQPDKGRNLFQIISNEIDFATTGDNNTMTCSLVDSQWSETSSVPVKLSSQEKKEKEKNVYTHVIIIPDEDLNTWRKIYESDMTNIPYNLLHKWTAELTKNKQFAITKAVFYAQMKLWNKTLFDCSLEPTTGWATPYSRKTVDKTANFLYRPLDTDLNINFPEIDYCFSTEAALPPITANLKRIYMKFPIMPSDSDYNDMNQVDDEKVLVYENGEWSMQLKTVMQKRFVLEAQ